MANELENAIRENESKAPQTETKQTASPEQKMSGGLRGRIKNAVAGGQNQATSQQSPVAKGLEINKKTEEDTNVLADKTAETDKTATATKTTPTKENAQATTKEKDEEEAQSQAAPVAATEEVAEPADGGVVALQTKALQARSFGDLRKAVLKNGIPSGFRMQLTPKYWATLCPQDVALKADVATALTTIETGIAQFGKSTAFGERLTMLQHLAQHGGNVLKNINQMISSLDAQNGATVQLQRTALSNFRDTIQNFIDQCRNLAEEMQSAENEFFGIVGKGSPAMAGDLVGDKELQTWLFKAIGKDAAGWGDLEFINALQGSKNPLDTVHKYIISEDVVEKLKGNIPKSPKVTGNKDVPSLAGGTFKEIWNTYNLAKGEKGSTGALKKALSGAAQEVWERFAKAFSNESGSIRQAFHKSEL